MLSQRLLNIMKSSKKNILHTLNTQQLTTSAEVFNRSKEILEKSKLTKPLDLKDRENKKAEREKNLIQESRNPFYAFAHAEIDFTPAGIKRYINKKRLHYKKIQQSYNQTRIDFLGPDLAIAYFIIYGGGKIKFRGSDKWIQINEAKNTVIIPNTFNPNYVVTAIDASGIELYYEALENFRNIPKVTYLNFARSPHFDDWFMDKLTGMFPNLEYLDASDCPKLSERGLEALYKTSKLKTLIVTNHYKSAAFELTCLMLEDILPELRVKILEPKEKMKPTINTNLSINNIVS